MKQHVETGIGRALRRARETRGKSLDDASRETRVRLDYLKAIEHEWFGALGSDVYVRGFLSSYARYLGLDPEKVVGAYERAYGSSRPSPSPVEQAPTVAPTEAFELTERKRPNWILAGGAALIVLAAAAAIGIVGGSDVPEPAALEPPPVMPQVERPVEVGIEALATTQVTVTVDGGEPEEVPLDEGGAVSFVGRETVRVTAPEGGLFGLIVNGHRIKVAGDPKAPFDVTYTPQHYREERSPQETPSG